MTATNRVIFGDCRDTMRDLKAKGMRVQCCVTSPPYYGLRDYGHPGQIGMEKTPAEYVAALVEVFDGVRELLADDGVLWMNLGDSYFSDTNGSGGPSAKQDSNGGSRYETKKFERAGLKPKDLIGIPWRVAFALQSAGWYLRQDIIWHKPNPMPESVTDRCTKAHEYMFLLSKSERYFWDAEAMQEPAETGDRGSSFTQGKTGTKNLTAVGQCERIDDGMRNRRSVWTVPTSPYSGAHFATFPPALIEPCILAGSRPGDVVLDPFFGSGTTGQVAQNLGRRWIGCELNAEYDALQLERTAQASLAI